MSNSKRSTNCSLLLFNSVSSVKHAHTHAHGTQGGHMPIGHGKTKHHFRLAPAAVVAVRPQPTPPNS